MKLQTIHRRVTDNYRRVKNNYRRLQTTHRELETHHRRVTGESQRSTDHRWQMSHKRVTNNYKRVTDKSQTNHRQLQLQKSQMSHRRVTKTTDESIWATDYYRQHELQSRIFSHWHGLINLFAGLLIFVTMYMVCIWNLRISKTIN